MEGALFLPLSLLSWQFLQQRGLHETYQGGIGSFMLQIMVYLLNSIIVALYRWQFNSAPLISSEICLAI